MSGLKLIRPIAPNWAPRPILQTLVQVDRETGPTENVTNWAPQLLRPVLVFIICNVCLYVFEMCAFVFIMCICL